MVKGDSKGHTGEAGFEPTASSFEDYCSTVELFALRNAPSRQSCAYQVAFVTPGSKPFETNSLIIMRDILKKLYTPRGLPVKTHRFRTLTFDPLVGLAPNLIEAANLFLVENSALHRTILKAIRWCSSF